MKVVEVGHIYELDNIDAKNPEDKTQRLVFVNREDKPHPGTQVQEVLRALIDRTRHCDNCLPHRVNDEIIYHFRKALALHEARAIERQVDKGEIEPEKIMCTPKGHFVLPISPESSKEYENEENIFKQRPNKIVKT
jgi:hypothetical protein